MSTQSRQTSLAYPEARAKRWLAWLARGMQRHGQTVFLIEQLQPSWLTTPGRRLAFLLSSRLILGLISGLYYGLFGFLFAGLVIDPSFWQVTGFLACIWGGSLSGLFSGLSFGLLEVRQYWVGNPRRVGKILSILKIPVYCLLSALSNGLGLAVVSAIPVLSEFHGLSDVDASSTFAMGVFNGTFVGLLFVTFFGARVIRRSLVDEIRTVESLQWSWWKAARSLSVLVIILGLLSGFVVLLFILQKSVGNLEESLTPRVFTVLGLLFIVLLGLLPVGLLYGLLGGFQQGVAEMKTAPNYGTRLSTKNAAITGGTSGLLFGLLGSAGSSLWTDLGSTSIAILGLAAGLLFGLISTLWQGGLDAIQHYLLRCFLALGDDLPWKLVPFLDYSAANLQFLQKVGGGYVFAHRYLLEHFAAIGDTAPCSRQTDASLAGGASSSLEPLEV